MERIVGTIKRRWRETADSRARNILTFGVREASSLCFVGTEQSGTLRLHQKSSESLTFHGTGGEAGHDSVLEDHHKDDQRDRYDHGGCHN